MYTEQTRSANPKVNPVSLDGKVAFFRYFGGRPGRRSQHGLSGDFAGIRSITPGPCRERFLLGRAERAGRSGTRQALFAYEKWRLYVIPADVPVLTRPGASRALPSGISQRILWHLNAYDHAYNGSAERISSLGGAGL